MSAALTDWYEPMRVLLQDRDPGARLFENATLRDAVRMVVASARIPGLSLTGDRLALELAGETLAIGTTKYALILLLAVKYMTAYTPDSYSYRTRALSEKFGSIASFNAMLDDEIYFLEGNGAMAGAWQRFAGWYEAHTGLNFWKQQTEVTVEGAPFRTVNFTETGASTS